MAAALGWMAPVACTWQRALTSSRMEMSLLPGVARPILDHATQPCQWTACVEAFCQLQLHDETLSFSCFTIIFLPCLQFSHIISDHGTVLTGLDGAAGAPAHG